MTIFKHSSNIKIYFLYILNLFGDTKNAFFHRSVSELNIHWSSLDQVKSVLVFFALMMIFLVFLVQPTLLNLAAAAAALYLDQQAKQERRNRGMPDK
jgi:hypothetical protein